MSFTPGNSYLVHCTFVRPKPKKKYIICLTEEVRFGIFYINTKANPFHPSTTQVSVTPGELSYLKYDSYINTAEMSVCLKETCVIVKDYGRIPDSLFSSIRGQVEASETLSPKTINGIINEFK